MAILLVRNDTVENIFETHPGDDWVMEGCTVENGEANVGWVRINGTWAPPLPPVPASISRRQCAKQMAIMGLITPTEALAMVKTGDMPAMVNAMVMGQPNEAFIRIDFAADTYERANPLLNQLMTAAGYDKAAIDQFFRDAAKV